MSTEYGYPTVDELEFVVWHPPMSREAIETYIVGNMTELFEGLFADKGLVAASPGGVFLVGHFKQGRRRASGGHGGGPGG